MNTTVGTSNFCTEPRRIWPFKIKLAEINLVYCRFQLDRFTRADLDALGMNIASIEKSVPKRQAEFTAGRICARKALQLLNGDGTLPQIGSNREPLWHPSTIGSITHNETIAAAAISRSTIYRGIGIDFETVIAPTTRENVLTEILTTAELNTYYSLNNEQRAQFFTIVFSAKESFFKALFNSVNKFFGFHDALVSNIDWSRGTLTLRLLTTLSDSFPDGRTFDALFFYRKNHVGTLLTI
ncbi:MAG: 4-phosphopantetheinyl transferase [Verrucomicrobiaceae bacterium]|nr:4-phosphopantetheinyl transferase [Verrucomicrobiaceae bacterium]